jgi:alginate O-acetyltransferase complex protein AlgI
LSFTQASFLAFFALVFGAYWALRDNRRRKLLLLAASYLFYGCWEPRFLGLILLSTSVDFAVGLALEHSEDPRIRRRSLAASVLVNLGILACFKYYGFFVDAALAVVRALGGETERSGLELVLPVGVSFFTLQSLSYSIDVYRRELAAERRFVDYALFVGFFPRLLAGPLVRAKHFLPQLADARSLATVDVRSALLLFALGYFKKACLADNLAPYVDPLFADPTAYAAQSRVLGALLYTVQLYGDFSGYSDMALATALLLGFELPKNFDAPFASRSVRELWRRWHVSWSRWLKDYVHDPLGGDAAGLPKTARNLLLTALVAGLWHGAQATFVLWGLLHGVALVVEAASRRARSGPTTGTALASFHSSVARATTLSFVVASFVLFRSEDLGRALEFFSGETQAGSRAELAPAFLLVIFALVASHVYAARGREALRARLRRLPDLAFYPALGGVCALLVLSSSLRTAPFIYFRF